MNYEGKVYRAPSGQWSWVITEDGDEVARGAGYTTDDDAYADMYVELGVYAEML